MSQWRSVFHTTPSGPNASGQLQPRNPGRIPVIDAMRGLAALGVALFHFSGQLGSGLPRFLHGYGWLGVDVFFLISGFVIPLSLHGRDYRLRDFPAFMLRRLVRLEPPYLASIALGILLGHAAAATPGFQGAAPHYAPGQVAAHLVYLVPLLGYDWLSPVYWSLAWEFAFYILVGMTYAAVAGRPLAWTVALAAVACGARYALTGTFDVRALEFVAGILAMRAVTGLDPAPVAGTALTACLAVILMVGGTATGVTVALATLAVITLTDVDCGPWACRLGNISYSLYLTHVPVGGRVINLGRRLVSGPGGEILLLGAAAAVSVAFAVVFARLVERPATRASRRIVMGR